MTINVILYTCYVKKYAIYRVIPNGEKIVFHRAVYYSRTTLINVERDKGSVLLLCIQSEQYCTHMEIVKMFQVLRKIQIFTQSGYKRFITSLQDNTCILVP